MKILLQGLYLYQTDLQLNLIISLKSLTSSKSYVTIICAFCENEKEIFTYSIIYHAKVAELADALDLGSSGQSPCGFESHLSHHLIILSLTPDIGPVPDRGLLTYREFLKKFYLNIS